MAEDEVDIPDEPQGHLWDDAWSHPELPEEEPIHPREQWTPDVRRTAHVTEAGRPQRRHLEVDTHHERFTLEPPPNGREPLAGINSPRRIAHPPTRITQAAPRSAVRTAARRQPARTGALARRGTVVGYRRGRGPLMGTLLVVLAIVLVALAAFAGWWLLARPKAASAAPPPRAIVVVEAVRPGPGAGLPAA